MKKTIWAVLFVCLVSLVHCCALTQKEVCGKSLSAVVRIDIADGLASGFIVSADGWVVTAGHVVYENGERRSAVAVVMPNGTTQLAQVFFSEESIVRDFALLKIEATNLPFLEFGEETEAEVGSDITIIGFPFSAENNQGNVTTKFCLAGMVAAAESITNKVMNHSINVNAIYFQGPAVKGISGGPIISRDTGRVIGIQSAKLAGIGPALGQVRKELINTKASGAAVQMGGADVGENLIEIINVMDRHLANGLGVATGADDASLFLRITKRNYEKQTKRR